MQMHSLFKQQLLIMQCTSYKFMFLKLFWFLFSTQAPWWVRPNAIAKTIVFYSDSYRHTYLTRARFTLSDRNARMTPGKIAVLRGDIRWVRTNQITEFTYRLHMFCDASKPGSYRVDCVYFLVTIKRKVFVSSWMRMVSNWSLLRRNANVTSLDLRESG